MTLDSRRHVLGFVYVAENGNSHQFRINSLKSSDAYMRQ